MLRVLAMFAAVGKFDDRRMSVSHSTLPAEPEVSRGNSTNQIRDKALAVLKQRSRQVVRNAMTSSSSRFVAMMSTTSGGRSSKHFFDSEVDLLPVESSVHALPIIVTVVAATFFATTFIAFKSVAVTPVLVTSKLAAVIRVVLKVEAEKLAAVSLVAVRLAVLNALVTTSTGVMSVNIESMVSMLFGIESLEAAAEAAAVGVEIVEFESML